MSDAPRLGINQIAPRNEMGMPSATQNARRRRRKSARIMKTRKNPTRPFRSIRSRRPCNILEKSTHTVREIPSGIRPCADSI